MDDPRTLHGKRKRKKSFIQKAKKYGKKGKFGRGSLVNEDTYQYFVRVMEMSRQEFDTDEEKVVFINNVFDETVGEEINLSCNQFISRAIENLLPSASEDVINRFTDVFGEDLRPIFGDAFASHVLQKLLLIVAKKTMDSLKKEAENGDDSPNANKDDWVIRVGRFGLNNIEDFAWDMYANHVLRTVLLCISGGEESEDINTGKGGALIPKSIIDKSASVLPKAYIELLKEYQQSLASWPQIAELAFEGLTSGLLQSLQYALNRAGEVKLCDKFVKLLIKECYKKYGNEERALFESDYALHLLDSSLATTSPEIFKQLYESCLKGKIQELAVNSKANFTVQRLFDFCPNKEMLEELLDEILEAENGMEAIFSIGFLGVLSSVAKACKRLGHKQGVFMLNLMKVLGCSQPADRQLQLVPLAIRMARYDSVFGDEEKEKSNQSEKMHVNLHGSVIIQAMFHFNKPIKVVNSLLEMSPPELQQIFCDPKGSHIMDAYMKSIYVGGKSRERLFKKLNGTYVAMATSKHGSRSLEAAWTVMPIKQRQSVASELISRESQVTASPFGRIIATNFTLSLFRRSVEDWVQFQSGQQKKRELFADIVGTDSKSTKASEPVKEEDT